MELSDTALRQRYARLHDAAAPAVASGEYEPDPIPAPGDARWGLSLVALPDDDVAHRLAAVAAELCVRSANPHAAYDADAVHVTVRSLTGFDENVDEDVVAAYRERFEAVLAGAPPLAISFSGAALASTGAIACGYADRGLTEIRRRLVCDIEANGRPGVPGGDGDRIRDTAHASLLVFRPGGAADPGLIAGVEAAQRLSGSFSTRSLSLVTYRIGERAIRTRLHATISW